MASSSYYHIVKFISSIDGSDSYRFVMRPNNSKTQLVGVSEHYDSREDATNGMLCFKNFVTDDIRVEVKSLDTNHKESAETKHLKVWMAYKDEKGNSQYMFRICDGEKTFFTSNGYKNKKICEKELKSFLEHANCDLQD